jgi:hypothetical protein
VRMERREEMVFAFWYLTILKEWENVSGLLGLAMVL